VIKRSEREKHTQHEVESQAEKEKFILRPDLMSTKKNKFIICTSDIYSRDLLGGFLVCEARKIAITPISKARLEILCFVYKTIFFMPPINNNN
jgi:hypothetical protein